MPNSNDVASNEMLWERVLSLLVVGASVLGGSAVLLIQALRQSFTDFHIGRTSFEWQASQIERRTKRPTIRPTRK
jgi:hypothetical protein